MQSDTVFLQHLVGARSGEELPYLALQTVWEDSLMASGYHLRTSFQGWSSLRIAYYLQSLSTPGSELP